MTVMSAFCFLSILAKDAVLYAAMPAVTPKTMCFPCSMVGSFQSMFAKLGFQRRPLYNIDKSTQGTLALHVARSGTKLEKTSLSTDGSLAPYL